MIRGSLLRGTALALGILLPAPARSSLRVVPDQFPTIQAALNAANPADSVMVRPGTYVEALTLSGKDITLFGEADSGSTVVTTNGTARILDVGAGVTANTTISELMFRKGFADRGGAVRCRGEASPVFRGCEFVSNVARAADSCGYGGGLFLDRGSLVVLEECLFLDNFADGSFGMGSWDGSGGAVAVWNGARVVARRTRFENNLTSGFEGGWGGAVVLMQSTGSFEDCVFTGNSGIAGGGAILARTGLTVVRCTFAANHGGAITCLEHSVAFCSPPGTVPSSSRIDSSVFRDHDGDFGVATVALEGSATVTANTFAYNRRAALLVSAQVGVDHNIVARNGGIGIVCSGSHDPGTILCNDVWENDGGNYGGSCSDLTGIDDNISLDPLFCNGGPARNLGLRPDSPCTDHSSCGRMGALGIECTLTGVMGPGGSSSAILLAPVPTPAGHAVTISFVLFEPSRARLEVYDPAGRRLAVLAEGAFGAGRHEVAWRRPDSHGPTEPGVYFVVLDANGVRHSCRIVVLR